MRGSAHYQLGDYLEAIADFNRAIEHQANNALVYEARGHAYGKLGKEKEAQADVAKAEELREGERRRAAEWRARQRGVGV